MTKNCARLLALLFLLLPFTIEAQTSKPKPKPKTPAKSLEIDSPRFAPVAQVIERALANHEMPGAVVLIGRGDRIVYRRAFGLRSEEPTRETMTIDTIFDCASLTKPVATATSIMRLLENGSIRLNENVSKYVPEFKGDGKDNITIRQLLTHYGGLRPDLDLVEPWKGKDEALRRIFAEKTVYPPGTHFMYSDIGFETLGILIERVSGMTVAEYAKTHIWGPLGMKETMFLPPDSLRGRIAPTEYDETKTNMLRGVVHDPTARRMGGVAGHAGMFSTADDLAKMARFLLSRKGPLSPLTIEKMTTPQSPLNGVVLRGLGWDIDSPYSTNRGELLPIGSFGHTGFTGTSLWIDPTTDTYIILLANGVHPRGRPALVSLRSKVANAVAAALDLTTSEQEKVRLTRITGYNELGVAGRRPVYRNATVKNGIDVLQEKNFEALKPNVDKPRRIGVITNHTGVDTKGQRLIDILAKAPGVKLAAIFSPEHGIGGTQDTTKIEQAPTDATTGAPIYSVYGDTDAKRRPDPEVLKNLDAVVYDIQDAGVRFYTYETTLGYFLEGCAKAGIELIVLDRPNPINGFMVQGAISDVGRESFVNYSQVPVRHGMTVGELAKMYNAERHIDAKLTVVPAENWLRGDWYDASGLMWINPSPNLRSLAEAALYPGVALVEGTNVSVGRGTDTPFELVGAPFIDPAQFASYLNGRNIPGVRFVPVRFKPTSSKYQNEDCGGVNVVLVDRNILDAGELGIELAAALMKLYPQQYKSERLDNLMINKKSFDRLVAGEDPRNIADDWRDEIEKFMAVRAKYLLYK